MKKVIYEATYIKSDKNAVGGKSEFRFVDGISGKKEFDDLDELLDILWKFKKSYLDNGEYIEIKIYKKEEIEGLI